MGIMLLKYLGFCSSMHTTSSTKQSPTVIDVLCNQFSLADLRKSTNNFDENRIIGRGRFGDVYKGCLKHNGASTDYSIALKRMKVKSNKLILVFKKEIELLCQLHHPNLVSLIGFCDHKGEKILVYDYMPNGSLHDYVNRKDKEPLSWKKRLEIFIGVAHGLHYLHAGAKRTIFHRNIKPSNILLDNNMVPKLSGFELSLLGPLYTSKPKPIEVELAGTFGYAAPEIFQNNTFTDKCDVFSFGMVLLIVLCAKDMQTIFDKMDTLEHLYLGESINKKLEEFPVEDVIDPFLTEKIALECWVVFMDIIKRCLRYEPNERPTMGEVEVELEHALALQVEADATKTCDGYSLLSTTIIKLGAPISA